MEIALLIGCLFFITINPHFNPVHFVQLTAIINFFFSHQGYMGSGAMYTICHVLAWGCIMALIERWLKGKLFN